MADEISNPAGVARGKEKGARLGSGEPQQQLNHFCLLGVFCASPSQIRFVPWDVQAVPCRGLVVMGQAMAQGDLQRTQVHSFPPEQDFRLDVSWFACTPTAVGGSPGSWQHLGVSQVDDKCQGPSLRVQMLTDLLALACGFSSGRSTGTPPLGGDFGDSVCVHAHIVIALSHSASHSATLCVSPAFPKIPLASHLLPLPQDSS